MAKCNLQRTLGTFGCSHSLVSVVLIVERGGGVGGGGQPPYSQCYSLSNISSSCIIKKKKKIYKHCEICFLSADRGTAVGHIRVCK